jgi:toxin ParE1/3/4
MNQRRIVIEPRALRDLNGIRRFLSGKASEVIVDSMMARLYGALDVLAGAPLIGRLRGEFPGSPRSFPVQPYIIFYVPLPEKGGIVVWHVVHGARDLGRIVGRGRK